MTTIQKLRVAIERSVETSEEELLYAYAAANLHSDIRHEDMPRYLKDYMGRVFSVYSLNQLRKGIQLAIQSVGFEKSPVLSEMVARGVYFFFKQKASTLAAPAQIALRG